MAGKDYESHGSGDQFERSKGDSTGQFARTADQTFVSDVRRAGGGFDGRQKTLFASDGAAGKSRGAAGRSVAAGRSGGKGGFESAEEGASKGGVQAAQRKAALSQRVRSAAKEGAVGVAVGGVRAGVGDDRAGDEVMPDDVANAYRSALRAKRMHDARKAAKAADGAPSTTDAVAEGASADAGADAQAQVLARSAQAAREEAEAARTGLFSSQGGATVGDGSIAGAGAVKVDVVNASASVNPHGIEAAARAGAQPVVNAAPHAVSSAPAAHGSEEVRQTMLAAQRANNVRSAMKASRLGKSADWVAGKAGGAAARIKAALGGKTAVAGVAKAGGGLGVIAAGGGSAAFLAASFLVLVFGIVLLAGGGSSAFGGNGAEAYTAWAERIAADDKVGYTMEVNSTPHSRTGFSRRADNDGWGDVDCSSFVYYALLNNGWTEEELGGSYPFTTLTMVEILKGCGFKEVDFGGEGDLQRGDILVSPSHTEIYAGEGKNVGAHSDYDGNQGDGNGKEVSVGNYYDGGWTTVLRCTRASMEGTIPEPYGTKMTYLAWSAITNESSEQYKFREAVGETYDSEGFAFVRGRYVVATTDKFGAIGDMYDFILEDGTVIPTVKGEAKDSNDPDINEWGHQQGAALLEFVVRGSLPDSPGNPACKPEWAQRVVAYRYVGHMDY